MVIKRPNNAIQKVTKLIDQIDNNRRLESAEMAHSSNQATTATTVPNGKKGLNAATGPITTPSTSKASASISPTLSIPMDTIDKSKAKLQEETKTDKTQTVIQIDKDTLIPGRISGVNGRFLVTFPECKHDLKLLNVIGKYSEMKAHSAGLNSVTLDLWKQKWRVNSEWVMFACDECAAEKGTESPSTPRGDMIVYNPELHCKVVAQHQIPTEFLVADNGGCPLQIIGDHFFINLSRVNSSHIREIADTIITVMINNNTMSFDKIYLPSNEEGDNWIEAMKSMPAITNTIERYSPPFLTQPKIELETEESTQEPSWAEETEKTFGVEEQAQPVCVEEEGDALLTPEEQTELERIEGEGIDEVDEVPMNIVVNEQKSNKHYPIIKEGWESVKSINIAGPLQTPFIDTDRLTNQYMSNLVNGDTLYVLSVLFEQAMTYYTKLGFTQDPKGASWYIHTGATSDLQNGTVDRLLDTDSNKYGDMIWEALKNGCNMFLSRNVPTIPTSIHLIKETKTGKIGYWLVNQQLRDDSE